MLKLLEYKPRAFWPFIIFIPVMISIILFQAVKDYRIENQKIKIECSLEKNLCTIQKESQKDKNFAFKHSDLKIVSTKRISRGCYDVRFFFKNSYDNYSLFGDGFCSTNATVLNFITEGFQTYILKNEEHLLIKTGEKFYLYWMDYFTPFVIILFLFVFFLLAKKLEFYVDSDRKVLITRKYNILNKCFEKETDLSLAEKFYSKYYNYNFLTVCKFKDKKEKIILVLPAERQKESEDFSNTLNKYLP